MECTPCLMFVISFVPTTTTLAQMKQYMQVRREQLADDEAAASQQNQAWEIRCTGIVYRQPVITPDVPSWKTDFQALQEDYHFKLGRNIGYPEKFWNVEVEQDTPAEGDGEKEVDAAQVGLENEESSATAAVSPDAVDDDGEEVRDVG